MVQFPKLDLKDPKAFSHTANTLKAFFEKERKALKDVFMLGKGLKAVFIEMDPILNELTRRTCPYCGKVCCINRHGLPEYADMVCFFAMDIELPDYDLSKDPGSPCQFLGNKGCALPRFKRPFRCTWYFCEPMLLELDLGPIKKHKEFMGFITLLAQRRRELLEVFSMIYQDRFQSL